MIFIDPLNPALTNIDSAKIGNSDSWASNHPSGVSYFEEYLPLFAGKKMLQFPNMSEFRFRNSPTEFQNQLVGYIGGLIESARKVNKTPVFKFEQLEGHVEVLRSNFPSAIHVGLIRDPKDQFDSWYEQLALGNHGFFDMASILVNGDLDFFVKSHKLPPLTDQDIFDVYYDGLRSLRSNLDFTFNLYEDDRKSFISQIFPEQMREIFESALARLTSLEKPPTLERKFLRMRARSVELTQQRDELTQQRDDLTQQRDDLTQQRDDLTQQRDDLTQQRDDLTQQRDELTQQRDELTQQRDDLTQQRDELTQQRDELTQQRDELTQQRDELTQQRDELTQQRDKILNSTIWRTTRPIRWFVNQFKR
jgi:hypothetical protein